MAHKSIGQRSGDTRRKGPSNQERKRLIERLLSQGYTPPGLSTGNFRSAINEATRRLGVKQNVLNKQITRGVLHIDWSKYKAPNIEKLAPSLPPEATPEQRAALTIRRLQDQSDAKSTRIKELERALNSKDDLRQSLMGLVSDPLPRRTIEIPTHRVPSTIDIPVILSSDIQYGERIRADEMDGINEYDPDIAQRRYRFQIKTAIELMTHHVSRPKYPAIYVMRLGDSISGRIHDELAETNALSDPECVRDLTAMEADGIAALHAAAKKATGQRSITVRVLSIPGNHGRQTKKPRAKMYVRHNWELTLAWSLEREFRGISDVEFVTPMSGDIYEQVYNTSFGLTHGDRIGSRGGTGFIGAAATVLRGTHKTRQMFAGVGKPVQYVVMGHFHDPMWMAHSIVNGCLPGYSEFARDLRFEPAPPSQSMFFVHPHWGVTTRREIILEKTTADGRPWNNILQKV